MYGDSSFNTKYLPKNMKKHSPQRKDKKLKFFDLINQNYRLSHFTGVFVCARSKME